MIYIEDNQVNIKNPHDANVSLIEMVHQDLTLVNAMSISRNFFLSREPERGIGPF
jgi:simple sugar transport system ATP-binding protein